MRRSQLIGMLAAAAFIPIASRAGEAYGIHHSDEQWRELLGADRFAILRRNGTEPAFSSPLLKETRRGTYRCAGCALPLFSSQAKYESGDGWPSFRAVLPGAISTRADFELVGAQRTEVHCRGCGGHLGHLFDDGPPPAHLRYCIDGLALRFETGADSHG